MTQNRHSRGGGGSRCVCFSIREPAAGIWQKMPNVPTWRGGDNVTRGLILPVGANRTADLRGGAPCWGSFWMPAVVAALALSAEGVLGQPGLLPLLYLGPLSAAAPIGSTGG